VHAGLYGARATDSGLILSYYGSAAVGRHDFKIDAGAPTDGSYTYAGVFVGAAVGGERQLGEMMVRPSVGIDLGYARTIGSEISVADVDLEVDPVTFARGFVSLGMTHEMDAGSLDFTPRLFCAVGGDSDDNACGFGGSLNYVTLADTEGARWDVSFDYERIADSQTASLRLARTWDIFATGTHVGHL
jgi:hypothetical protein